MDYSERFDKITQVIDELSEEGIYKEREIAKEAFRRADSEYMIETVGDMLFKWMTAPDSLTVIKYIKRRQMMAAYKNLLSKPDEERGFEKEVMIADVGDQAKFNNAFKRIFGMTPSQARKQKDWSLYQERITWDRAGKNKGTEDAGVFDRQPEQSLFGKWLAKETDKKNQHIEYLQRTYDLNLTESQFAYMLSEETEYTVDDCFEYIYTYIYKYIGQALYDTEMTDRDNYLKEDLGNKDVQYMYFECDFGFSMIESAVFATMSKTLKNPIQTYSPNELAAILVGIYPEYNCPQELVDYFNTMNNGIYSHYDFCLYLYLVLKMSCSPEKAIELIPGKKVYNYDKDTLYFESCRLLHQFASIYNEDAVMYYTPPEWFEDVNEVDDQDIDCTDDYERREFDYLGDCPYENWELYNWENYCEYEEELEQKIPPNKIPEVEEDERSYGQLNPGMGLFENARMHMEMFE